MWRLKSLKSVMNITKINSQVSLILLNILKLGRACKQLKVGKSLQDKLMRIKTWLNKNAKKLLKSYCHRRESWLCFMIRLSHPSSSHPRWRTLLWDKEHLEDWVQACKVRVVCLTSLPSNKLEEILTMKCLIHTMLSSSKKRLFKSSGLAPLSIKCSQVNTVVQMG